MVAHHIEFVAGILIEELCRASLDDMRDSFASIVRGGICTMDPLMATWIRKMTGVPGDYAVPMRWQMLFADFAVAVRIRWQTTTLPPLMRSCVGISAETSLCDASNSGMPRNKNEEHLKCKRALVAR